MKIYKEVFRVNKQDFEDKIVLDVGLGLGVLSLLTAELRPRKIYAVDPSGAVAFVEAARDGNDGPTHRANINVYKSRVGSIELPLKVDTIICDCFREMLLDGQMLESFLIAGQRFLAPGGDIV